jgi:hypothetical protein
MRLPGLIALGFLSLSAPWSSADFLPGSAAIARAPQTCGSDSYVNVDGKCVHRPVQADRPPAGATAKCRDGAYSFSQHRSGTCSHHGGVAAWL